MTLFEYLAIAFSLVLSFAAMRILAGLPHVIDSGRRYWVHLAFVLCSLLVTAVGFWSMWNFRVVEWSLVRFLLVLTIPGSFYFMACVLVPEQAASVESWRDYYYANRRRYFAGLFVAIFSISVALYALLDVPLLDPRRAPQIIGGIIAIIGVASSDERVHRGLAAALAISFAVVSLVIMNRPSFLVSGMAE